MIYNKKELKIYCSKCNSTNIYIKSGLMTDLYVCRDCGHESRNLTYI